MLTSEQDHVQVFVRAFERETEAVEELERGVRRAKNRLRRNALITASVCMGSVIDATVRNLRECGGLLLIGRAK